MQTWQSLKLHQDQGIMTNEIQSWQTSSPLHILICPCKPAILDIVQSSVSKLCYDLGLLSVNCTA